MALGTTEGALERLNQILIGLGFTVRGEEEPLPDAADVVRVDFAGGQVSPKTYTISQVVDRFDITIATKFAGSRGGLTELTSLPRITQLRRAVLTSDNADYEIEEDSTVSVDPSNENERYYYSVCSVNISHDEELV